MTSRIELQRPLDLPLLLALLDGGRRTGTTVFRASVTDAGGLSDYDVAWSARRNKLFVTLASALACAGRATNPAMEYEVGFHRARAARYDSIFKEIRRRDPAARRFKGAVFSSRYPEGWQRRCGDLDVVASSPQSALGIAESLVKSGWEVIRATAVRRDGTDHYGINLTHPSPDPYIADEDWVQLASFSFRGTPVRLPIRVQLPHHEELTSEAKTLVALVEEVAVRGPLQRDILDAAVLIADLSLEQMELARSASAELYMAAAWNRLQGGLVAMNVLTDEQMLPLPQYAYVGRSAHIVRALSATGLGAAAAHRAVGVRRSVLLNPRRLYARGLALSGQPNPHAEMVKRGIRYEGTSVRIDAEFGSCELVYRGVI